MVEASGISLSTMNKFFKDFLAQFVEKYEDTFIKLPTEKEDVDKVLAMYARLGLSGCIGSMDCTHIHWEKCPVWLYNECKGKYQWPTLAIEAIVDHNRRFMSISPAFPGANNDINIAYADKTLQKIVGGLYHNYDFVVHTAEGDRRVQGLYLITDGGYIEWRCLMYPEKDPCLAIKRYSEWLESVRKDVECAFGILIGRFRLFKRGVELHKKKDIEAALKVCAILHNMLLDEDGKNIDINWEILNPPDSIDDENSNEEGDGGVGHVGEEKDAADEEEDGPVLAVDQQPLPAVLTVSTHYMLKFALARHFNIAFGRGEVQWPRRNKKSKSLEAFEAFEQLHGKQITSLLFIFLTLTIRIII